MSKYIKGDKVVMEITDRFKNSYGHEYYSILDSVYSTEFIDEKSEPLRDYTEPLEAKIRRQAAEITRLLAENKRLKAENGNSLWNIEQAKAEGQNEAWELARKLSRMEIDDKIQEVFNLEYSFALTVIEQITYPEAAAKVAEWEKAKEEIKVGDVYEGNIGSRCFVIRNIDEETNDVEILWLDLAPGNRGIEEIKHYKKTGRHIDIDSFLKQIGGEE